ncbi:MAG: helix-turn-helix domain-containing protein [Chloroflexota bacterium]
MDGEERAMRGRKAALKVELSEAVRQTLEGWLRATSTPLGTARRARALLLLADGVSYVETARLVGLADRHVRKWVRRFVRDGLDGLHDLPRSGRPPAFPPSGSNGDGQARLRAPGGAGAIAVAVG